MSNVVTNSGNKRQRLSKTTKMKQNILDNVVHLTTGGGETTAKLHNLKRIRLDKKRSQTEGDSQTETLENSPGFSSSNNEKSWKDQSSSGLQAAPLVSGNNTDTESTRSCIHSSVYIDFKPSFRRGPRRSRPANTHNLQRDLIQSQKRINKANSLASKIKDRRRRFIMKPQISITPSKSRPNHKTQNLLQIVARENPNKSIKEIHRVQRIQL
ncbi:hypothetical protein ACOSQ4_008073 [Xanthoceras sorbifolium]